MNIEVYSENLLCMFVCECLFQRKRDRGRERERGRSEGEVSQGEAQCEYGHF